jgi:hypothetical protein
MIVALAVGASAALGVVVKANGGDDVDYNQPTFSQPQGVHSTFENESIGPVLQFTHNVVSDGSLGGYKVFASKTIIPGQTIPINGTQYLTTGDYPFHCSVHPSMQATLHVTSAGTPVARPDIEIKILTISLRQARKLKGVQVQIDAATKSPNIGMRVEWKLSGNKAGFVKDIDVAAGHSKIVRVKFKQKALNKIQRALAENVNLAIKATAKVRFGERDSDSQVLHHP